MAFRKWLPESLKKPLFGNRKKWGLVPLENDPCWQEWTEEVYAKFYYANQKTGAGDVVNNSGYAIMNQIDWNSKKVLEVGPGEIRHLPYWHRPNEKDYTNTEFVIADIYEGMLNSSGDVLEKAGIPCRKVKIDPENEMLPFEDSSFDAIVTFYALEHIYPLDTYLDELRRVLKSGGLLIGAIPAEGGLAWGLGRYLTSRQWLLKNSTIDPEKLICWEHPNFSDEILNLLDQKFKRQKVKYWPLKIPLIDTNLTISFIYKKV